MSTGSHGADRPARCCHGTVPASPSTALSQCKPHINDFLITVCLVNADPELGSVPDFVSAANRVDSCSSGNSTIYHRKDFGFARAVLSFKNCASCSAGLSDSSG